MSPYVRAVCHNKGGLPFFILKILNFPQHQALNKVVILIPGNNFIRRYKK